MADMKDEQWYHGDIDREEAENRLENTQIGTYLLRECQSREGYSLSLRVPDRVKHFIVTRKPPHGYFQLVGKPGEFPTVSELVLYYSHNPTSTKDQCKLKYACGAATGEEAPAEAEPAVDRTYVDLLDAEANPEVAEEVAGMAAKKRVSVQLQKEGKLTEDGQMKLDDEEGDEDL